LVRAVLDGAGVKVYLQRDNLGRRMREHRLMVVKYRLKENLGSKKQLATPIVFSPTPLDGDISTRFPTPRRTRSALRRSQQRKCAYGSFRSEISPACAASVELADIAGTNGAAVFAS